MKFILNKDTLKIKDAKIINSGSENYYEADVEYDESWENLIIEAKIVKKGHEVGIPRAVINNKIFIDVKDDCRYCIGFVGYIIKDGIMVYQISSNLQPLTPEMGAGQIKTSTPALPTPTEWEVYIAQIEEMLKNAGGSGGGKIDDVRVDGTSVVKDRIANINLRQTIIDILVEYGLIQLEDLTEEQIKALDEMVCEINENGNLIITYDETILDLDFQIEDGNLIIDNNINATFSINENEELEVEY